MRCIDSNNQEFVKDDINTDLSNSIHIFHQNIRGLRNKADELLSYFEIDGISPHILCLSEHHMDEQDLLHLALPGYVLGSCFCRQNLEKGGVCIFICKNLRFSKINTLHNCKEKDLEMCAIELETKASKLIILC